MERDGEPVQIGSRAFDILTHLLEHSGQVVSHRALLEAAWPTATVEDGNLRFQMNALRKALGSSEAKHIINVPGRGYSFVGPIARHEGVEPPRIQPQAPSERYALPPPPSKLIGRDEAIGEISSLVPLHRIVTVVGPGGMGKTTAAIAVANRFEEAFRDGVCFVELAPVDDARRVADSLAIALGLPVRSEDPIGEILVALKSRQMLIVCDSCEHVIGAAAALIEKIVTATANVRFLATSRESLRIQLERIFRLEALASPPIDGALSAAESLSYPAAQLFAERAGATNKIVSSDRRAQLVARICGRLDGLPLAIEIAACLAEAFDLEELAQMLDESLSLTWQGRRTAPERHQTLGAMLEWSYRLLREEEKTALRALSIFSRRFSLEEASAAADMRATGHDISHALAALVSKSLLSVEFSDEGTKYRLLDTTRTYARKKLSGAGEFDAVRRRHALFYLQDLIDHRAADEIPRPVKRGRDNMDEVRAAIAWAFQSEPALAVRLVAASIPLLESLGLFQEEKIYTANALTLLEQATEGARLELELQSGLARATIFTSKFGEDYNASWSRVQQLAESLHQTDGQLAATVILWGQKMMLADIPEARKYANSFRRNSEASLWTGMADWMEGVTSIHLGDYASARDPLRRAAAEGRPAALALQRRLVTFDCRRVALMHTAHNCLMEGDVVQANELAEQAVARAYADDLDFPIEIVDHLGAITFNLMGDRERVRALALNLLQRSEERSLTNFLSIARGHLSAIDAWRGNEEALVQLGEDIVELQHEGYGFYIQYFMAERLRISIERIRNGLQASELEPLTPSPERIGAWFLPEFLRVNGRLAALQGRENDAERLLLEGLGVARRQASPFWELRVANELAELWAADGRAEQGQSLLKDVIPKLTTGRDTEDLARAQALLEGSRRVRSRA